MFEYPIDSFREPWRLQSRPNLQQKLVLRKLSENRNLGLENVLEIQVKRLVILGRIESKLLLEAYGEEK